MSSFIIICDFSPSTNVRSNSAWARWLLASVAFASAASRAARSDRAFVSPTLARSSDASSARCVDLSDRLVS